jgi:hypothetical protein
MEFTRCDQWLANPSLVSDQLAPQERNLIRGGGSGSYFLGCLRNLLIFLRNYVVSFCESSCQENVRKLTKISFILVFIQFKDAASDELNLQKMTLKKLKFEKKQFF